MKKEDLIAKLTEKKGKLVKETEKYDDREFMQEHSCLQL